MPDVKGTVSPFSSSSSRHEEEDPKTVEYYVKGGENMSDNNIGITSAPDDSYSVPQGTTTEPDPQSELAMQKGDICCADCQGSACDGNCCDKCMGMMKADKPESAENASDEPDNDADDKVEKSAWAGFFRPGLPAAALRTVFRINE